MKKLLFALFAFILLLSVVHAQEAESTLTKMSPPYDGKQIQSPTDYYQVLFDEEGDANIVAKLIRLNPSNENVTQITIEIPGGKVNLKYAFQEIKQKNCYNECLQYEQKCEYYEQVCKDWNYQTSKCDEWTARCASYTGICINQQYRCYPGWQSDFVPLKYEQEQLSKSVKYTFTLKEQIGPGDGGTLLLFYKSPSYVSKLINYNFDFESIKSPTDLEYLRVAISVDSDLYLRGMGTRVDYRSDYVAAEKAADFAASGVAGAYAEELSRYSSSIQYAQGYVKEKHNLDAWEGFHVKGKYNTQSLKWLTYIKEFLYLIIFLIAVKLLFASRIKEAFGIEQKTKGNKYVRAAVTGFISAFSLAAIAWLSIFVLTKFLNMIGYEFRSLFAILFILITGIILLGVFIGPSLYIAKKYGMWEGFLTFGSTVMWLFVFMLVFTTLFSGDTNPPIYYARSLAESISGQMTVEKSA